MIVVWQISTHCNLRCGFCAFDRGIVMPRTQVDAADVRRFADLLGQYQAQRGEPVHLSWLGGEPTLWPPCVELSYQLRDAGLTLSMTSNGSTLQQPKLLAMARDCLSELTLSVDGLAATHDRLRGRPGLWQQQLDTVRTLRAQRRPGDALQLLRVNTVLMRDTLPDFAALCVQLAQAGADQITVNLLGGRDRPDFYAQQKLQPDDYARWSDSLPALQDRLCQTGCTLSLAPTYLAALAARVRGISNPIADCQPGQRFLFIDANGQVAPCSYTSHSYGVALGSILTVQDLQNLASQFRSAQSQRRDAICDDCPSTQQAGKFAPPFHSFDIGRDQTAIAHSQRAALAR